jgi:hypothetical protein
MGQSQRARSKGGNAPQPGHRAADRLRKEVINGGQAARAVAAQTGTPVDAPPPVPEDVSLAVLREIWDGVQYQAGVYRKALAALEEEARATQVRQRELEQAEQLADEAAKTVENDRAALATDRAALQDREARHQEAEQELAARRHQLDTREKELNARHASLEQGRIDAEAGYLEQERVHLSRLTDQRRHLLAELAEERERLYADIDRRNDELAELRRRTDAELAERRRSAEAELSRQDTELRERALQIADRERTLRALAENHEEDQAYLRKQAELAVADQIRRLELDLDRARRDYTVIMDHARDLERQRDERDESLRRVGHEAPEILARQLRELTEENKSLHHKLATTSSAVDPELLAAVQREHAQCQETRSRLEFEVARLRSENNAYLIANTELEELREHRDRLQHSVNLHKKLLDDAQAQLDGLVNSAHAPRPFPGLDELDSSPKLQTVLPATNTPPDLAELTGYIRQRIAADRDHRQGPIPLAYRDRDIRCLLGGLAMSHLHILEGISGIGKTTFPKAFAAAIGADYEVIEVQAGWHDRQDLIGSMNAFEHRYYETAFTKAVYQAGCAAHENRPFFIILDEMNLAHPEQYFADILSGLENWGVRFHLQLTSHPVEPVPRLLVTDKGVHLPVPENVWFFGTSNQDETTVQFADKTYDRANIIELPTRPPQLAETSRPPDRDPLSYRALQRSFGKAWTGHRDVQESIVGFLRKHLAQSLLDDFQIAWGPRLEKQVRDFAPVVVAAGGTAGEAADHILATRVLRRLKGRYSLRAEQIEALRDLIDTSWHHIEPSEDDRCAPVATRALLGGLAEEGA